MKKVVFSLMLLVVSAMLLAGGFYAGMKSAASHASATTEASTNYRIIAVDRYPSAVVVTLRDSLGDMQYKLSFKKVDVDFNSTTPFLLKDLKVGTVLTISDADFHQNASSVLHQEWQAEMTTWDMGMAYPLRN